MAVYRGEAYAQTANATGARHFKLSTSNTDTGPTNRAWELNAGESITLYFRSWTTGLLPPDLPDGDSGDSVILDVYYETGTSTLVRTLHNGSTAPASGTSYTFHATSNGGSGGSARSGTLRLRVRVVQASELVGNYNIDSDSQDQGKLRCNIKFAASGITHDGYPSGSTYAIGTGSTETVTLRALHPQPFQERGHEQCRIDLLDGTSVQATGTTKAVTGVDTTQSFSVNNSVFDDTSKEYGARVTPFGNAQLQSTSGGGNELWATFIAEGIGLVGIDTQSFPSNVHDIAIDASTGTAYLSTGTLTIRKYNYLTWASLGTISAANSIRYVSWDNDLNLLVGFRISPNTLFRLNPSNGNTVNQYDPDFISSQVAYDSSNGYDWCYYISADTIRGFAYPSTSTVGTISNPSDDIDALGFDKVDNTLWAYANDVVRQYEVVGIPSVIQTINKLSGATPSGMDVYNGKFYVCYGNSTITIAEIDGTSQRGDAVERLDFFLADPRVTINNISLGESLYNRGESTTIDFNVRNARNENLTRSLTLRLRDSGGTQKTSISDTGSNYDLDYTIGISDDSSYDFTGVLWTFEASHSEFTTVTDNAYRVSRKLKLGTSVNSNNLQMSSGQSTLRNRGETHTFEYFISYARGTAYASISGLNQTIFDGISTSTVENSQTNEITGSDGKVTSSYTIGTSDLAAYDFTGREKDLTLTDDLGNSCDRAENVWFVSSKYRLHSSIVDSSSKNNRIVNSPITLRNRGETHSFNYYLGYARGAVLPSMSNITQHIYTDSDTGQHSSGNRENTQTNVQTNSSGQVNASYTITGSGQDSGDKALFSLISGSPKHIHVLHSGNEVDDSLDSWEVTKQLSLGSTPQSNDKNMSLVEIDSGPNDGLAETIFNRGETVRFRAYVGYARGANYDQQITAEVHSDESHSTDGHPTNELSESSPVLENTGTSSLSGGQFDRSYVILAAHKAISALGSGSPKHVFIYANGNHTEAST